MQLLGYDGWASHCNDCGFHSIAEPGQATEPYILALYYRSPWTVWWPYWHRRCVSAANGLALHRSTNDRSNVARKPPARADKHYRREARSVYWRQYTAASKFAYMFSARLKQKFQCFLVNCNWTKKIKQSKIADGTIAIEFLHTCVANGGKLLPPRGKILTVISMFSG